VSAENQKHAKNHDHKDQAHSAGSTASLKQKMHNDSAQDAIHAQLLEHPSYIEMQTKLNEAEEKANQYWDRMLRMQAESENAQRRVQRDIENAHKYGLEKFASDLLPVIDSLERAMSLSDDHQHSVLEGVQLTLKMFYGVLEKFGVKQIDPVGQPFNPEFHQAVSTVVDPAVQPNTVKDVLQKGYTLNNRLIRPALVVVSKAS
jgi:molecular chaperone GrpE